MSFHHELVQSWVAMVEREIEAHEATRNLPPEQKEWVLRQAVEKIAEDYQQVLLYGDHPTGEEPTGLFGNENE